MINKIIIIKNIYLMFNNRESWTSSFFTTIKLLKFGGKVLPKNTQVLRTIADTEIPSWTPTLPNGVRQICFDDEIIKGEWVYPDGIFDIYSHNKFIFYIHGGAFSMCKPGTHRGLVYRLAKKTNSVVFSIDYRRSPEFKYPIPLEDCIMGYLYLLNKVRDYTKITIAGDSAGGNLSIHLISQLIQSNIAVPPKCLLISPWVDLTDFGKYESWKINKKFDFINEELARHFAFEYINQSTNKLEDVSCTNISDHVLMKFPQMLIEYGECEVLHDQIKMFCLKLKTLGVNITDNCRKDMVHVFPMFHFTGITQSKEFFNKVILFIN